MSGKRSKVKAKKKKKVRFLWTKTIQKEKER